MNTLALPFAARIARLRAKRRMSARAVARELRLPKSTYCSWEAGTRTPPTWTQNLIVRAMQNL